MLRITIETHRYDEPAVEWIINALKYKQVPFIKKVYPKTDGIIKIEILKKERNAD